MATREGSWWSRAWGTVAVAAFALHLGGAVYEAAVLAPVWSIDPPKSVIEWVANDLRPDSSILFHPLAVIIALSTSMAWLSGITARGWRRWWLTLALASAGALGAITVQLMLPVERELFAGATRARADATDAAHAAEIIAWTNEWVRVAAFRLAALLVGAWASYRAQLAGMLGERAPALSQASDDDGPVVPARRRAGEFSFGDEPDSELTLGDDVENPRQRWRRSLADHRRRAKK